MGTLAQTMNGPHDRDARLGQRIHLPGKDHQLLEPDPALQQIAPGDTLSGRLTGTQTGRHDAATHQLIGSGHLACRL